MKIPNWLYVRLERLYLAQRTVRRDESKALMEAEDRAARAYYAKVHELHAAGKCGGAKLGCCYVPCIPRVRGY